LATKLNDESREHARRISREMGKTLAAAESEVDKCANVCRHYADNAVQYLADVSIPTEAGSSYVHYLPLGVILGVMPWNFPYWQAFRWAVPTVMAGNVVLLKHSSNVSGCALAIEHLFSDVGFTESTFQSLLIGSARVTKVLADPRVVGVSLTGSEAAGAAVASIAGRHIKKCVLELGGSDAFIVMPSAQLDRVASMAVAARIVNNGQSCIAAKRFIVHADCYDAFLAEFVHHFKSLKVGDPCDASVDIGPIASESGRSALQQQVASAYAAGARVSCGGRCMEGPGYFFEPTVISDIPPNAPINRQEVFGPVALVYRVRDINEAISLANDNPYGLGSSVWTEEPDEQRRFIDELQSGMTFINAIVASDPRLPFGGVKQSGYGRELGPHGILEFVNAKTVYVR
jgi:succinate-semialdehyde dehydrogenase/glutarate-semialdehyde dehydrogenase